MISKKIFIRRKVGHFSFRWFDREIEALPCDQMRPRSLFKKNDCAIILTSVSTRGERCFHQNSAGMTMILLHRISMMLVFARNITALSISSTDRFFAMPSRSNWNPSDKVEAWLHPKTITTIKPTFCGQSKFVSARPC